MKENKQKKIKQLIDKIQENATEIRMDWSDPRSECRAMLMY